MKTWLLIALVFLAGLSGMAVAANMSSNGILAYLSYHLILPPITYNTIAAYINLGNLTPGMNGTVESTAHLFVNSSGYFKVVLHHEGLDDVFSNFTVTITIGNQTVTLNQDKDEHIVYLMPGNYTVSITVYYTVRSNPKGPLGAVNKPLVVIKPVGEHEGDHGDNYTAPNGQGSDKNQGSED
ncbi:hypothetical protein [Vulcanisaeta souniana]|uniref:Uncharacterized protein n=1 Tax=Vulcanisaeta souniana JCM 11219 TaxID=1293586 RepID=A0A830E4K6_9CREN|nr:hypothetical protein [Vulcanisaeta souniana]BDR92841.1 hypothetical protein Vsou_19340 [Vulcanisaeta souniana JCM 11219]GGI81760.1 hypothetical protein GCM10007112_18060 [Vulcanisaeta souniana JCM 11219]